MPNIIKQKPALLISAGIICITLIIGLKIIYHPKQTRTNQLKGQIQKEMARNVLIKEIISQQNDLKRYQNKFSPQPDTSWLEEKVRQLAEKLNIELMELSQKPVEQISGLSPLSLEVKLRGNYHQIGKLVSQLEKAPEFIEVKRIKIVSISFLAWDKLIQSKEELAGADYRPRPIRNKGLKEELDNSKINQADLETILNKGQEAEVILEVYTFYAQ